MMRFTRYEPVTVTDINSPFYNWSGTVEKVIVRAGAVVDNLTIKCTYGGLGIGPTLWLTFHPEQLAKGIPAVADVEGGP